MTGNCIEIADYVLLALSCFFVILGLFRGVSGFFSLVGASVVSFATSVFLWPGVCGRFASPWVRVVAIVLAALVVFGLVRIIVARFVSRLLSQPADSMFGLLLGLALGGLLIYIVASVPMAREYSVIAREVSHLIKVHEDVR